MIETVLNGTVTVGELPSLKRKGKGSRTINLGSIRLAEATIDFSIDAARDNELSSFFWIENYENLNEQRIPINVTQNQVGTK